MIWTAGGIEFRGGPWDGWRIPLDHTVKKLVFVRTDPEQGIRTLYHYENKIQEHVPRMVLQYTEDKKILKKRKKK